MELGRFFQRAGQILSESVGGAARTVDQDFESRKAEYNRFAKEFAALWKKLDLYFKAVREDAMAYEKIAQGSKVLYAGYGAAFVLFCAFVWAF